MNTLNPETIKSQFAKVAKKAGTAATYVIIGGACLIGGYFYSNYKNRIEPEKPRMQIQPSIKLKTVSIAINERNEMIIIDRNTGEYTTYQDSVGMAVFSMYAGKIYASKNEQ